MPERETPITNDFGTQYGTMARASRLFTYLRPQHLLPLINHRSLINRVARSRPSVRRMYCAVTMLELRHRLSPAGWHVGGEDTGGEETVAESTPQTSKEEV